jgi:hypothetical protein
VPEAQPAEKALPAANRFSRRIHRRLYRPVFFISLEYTASIAAGLHGIGLKTNPKGCWSTTVAQGIIPPLSRSRGMKNTPLF